MKIHCPVNYPVHVQVQVSSYEILFIIIVLLLLSPGTVGPQSHLQFAGLYTENSLHRVATNVWPRNVTFQCDIRLYCRSLMEDSFPMLKFFRGWFLWLSFVVSFASRRKYPIIRILPIIWLSWKTIALAFKAIDKTQSVPVKTWKNK